MQTRQHFIESMLQTAAHCPGAVFQPLTEHGLQVFYLWTTIKPDDIHVHTVVFLEIRCRKQVRHNGLGIDPVGFRYDNKTGWIFVIRLVPQIRHQW